MTCAFKYSAQTSARVVLPSFLAKKRHQQSLQKSSKRAEATQSWDRDIVCLPKDEKKGTTALSYPRGKYRKWLAEQGLIGKIHLESTMTADEVQAEVRSVFTKAMCGRSDFPFCYLQPNGAGTRSLSIPSVSASFSWSAQQVVKLAVGKHTIYIRADDTLQQLTEVITGVK